VLELRFTVQVSRNFKMRSSKCPVALKEHFCKFLKRRVGKTKTDNLRCFVLTVKDGERRIIVMA